MDELLHRLLDNLEEVAGEYDEVFDSDVRERMHRAIERGWVKPVSGYVVPNEFGMFSREGNLAVRDALEHFLDAAPDAAADERLDTPQQRLDAFQNAEVTSSGDGHTYDEFFGHADKV